MTYQEAKEMKIQLENINQVHSDELKKFEKNSMGFTPDHIRNTPDFRKAKNDYDRSFIELRNFNGWFMKAFKKEYAADRRNRYKKA